MRKVYIILIFGLLLFSSCSERTNTVEEQSNDLGLVKKQCFNCHNPEVNLVSRIAPSPGDIRSNYLKNSTDKESFVKEMIHFIENPGIENSKMPEAVQQYGIMPKLSYSEDDLEKIANFFYDHDFSSDEWMTLWNNFSEKSTPIRQDVSVEEAARQFANQTKSALGKQLLGAIKEKGTAGAVAFCNTKAIHITDSMSQVLRSSIKRVSDKPRNPSNRANEQEIAIINDMKEQLAQGNKMLPVLRSNEGSSLVYIGIETNDMCLQCHGTPGESILPETLDTIRLKYPQDEATGYQTGQVRGVFVVEIPSVL